MAADMLYELIMGGTAETLGSTVLLGIILVFVLGILLVATGLPLVGAIVVEFGFIWGLVTQGWIPLWVKGIFALIIGIILYFAIGSLFKGD